MKRLLDAAGVVGASLLCLGAWVAVANIPHVPAPAVAQQPAPKPAVEKAAAPSAPIVIKVKLPELAKLQAPGSAETTWVYDETAFPVGQVYHDTAKRTLVLSGFGGPHRAVAVSYAPTSGFNQQIYLVTFEGGPVPPVPPDPPVPPPDSFAAKLKRAFDADSAAGKLKVDELKVVQQIAAQAHLVLDVAPDTAALYGLMDFAFDKAVTKGDMPTLLPLIKDRIKETAAVNEKLTDPVKAKFRLVFTEVARAIESLLGPVPPPPGPAPIPESGLHVLIVYESSSLTPAQNLMISGAEVRGYVRSKGGEYRAYDKDTPLVNEAKWVQAAAQRPRTGLPWIIVSNHPRGGFEGPLPATVSEAMTLLKKWGE